MLSCADTYVAHLAKLVYYEAHRLKFMYKIKYKTGNIFITIL